MWKSSTWMAITLATLISLPEISLLYLNRNKSQPHFLENDFDIGSYIEIKKQYIRHVYSLLDIYKSSSGDRVTIETNALIDTKYRTWKRNVDLINSLLALPKGLNEAGR